MGKRGRKSVGWETKILTLEFLKKHKGTRFSIRELHREMAKEYRGLKVHYLTVHKNVKEMLSSGEKGLKQDNRRFVIFVWYEDD